VVYGARGRVPVLGAPVLSRWLRLVDVGFTRLLDRGLDTTYRLLLKVEHRKEGAATKRKRASARIRFQDAMSHSFMAVAPMWSCSSVSGPGAGSRAHRPRAQSSRRPIARGTRKPSGEVDAKLYCVRPAGRFTLGRRFLTQGPGEKSAGLIRLQTTRLGTRRRRRSRKTETRRPAARVGA
jgi:hypothetical protein